MGKVIKVLVCLFFIALPICIYFDSGVYRGVYTKETGPTLIGLGFTIVLLFVINEHKKTKAYLNEYSKNREILMKKWNERSR